MKPLRDFLVIFTLVTLTFIIFSNPAFSQDVEVDLEVGPRLEANDDSQIKSCINPSFQEKFPLDIILEEPEHSNDCPSLNIFGNIHQACYLLEIFLQFQPVFIFSIIVAGIINL